MPARHAGRGSASDPDRVPALLRATGPRGVGVDTVIAESGVAKATLYKHFPRKDDLVLAYLDRVDQAWFGALRAAARDAGDEPRDQLVGMFDALGRGLPPGRLPRLRVHQHGSRVAGRRRRCTPGRSSTRRWSAPG